MGKELLCAILEKGKTSSEVVDFEDLYTHHSVENYGTSVIHQMLTVQRGFVIDVKAKIMYALIRFSGESWWRKFLTLMEICRAIKIYPKPTKQNVVCANSKGMLDISDKFFDLLDMPQRRVLFEKAYQLMIVEFEHDGVYSSIRDWWIEEIVKLILEGKWQPRPKSWPLSKWWKEPAPYGGEYSIVSKLINNRKAINELLEARCNESVSQISNN